MGSFDYTCGVSNLPIADGDPVRCVLLGAVGDTWMPRSFDIRAKYNDYGSICAWEEGCMLDSMLGAFSDLVESGQPADEYCDVRVGMDAATFFAALRAGQIFVHSIEDAYTLRAPPVYWPTRASVSQKLGDLAAKAKVHELVPGLVIVAWQGYGPVDEQLRHLHDFQRRLTEYATVVVAQAGTPVLRCFAPVIPNGHGYSIQRGPELVLPDPTIQIRSVLIREDVWQLLLTLEPVPYNLPSRADIAAQVDRCLQTNRDFPLLSFDTLDRSFPGFRALDDQLKSLLQTSAVEDFRERVIDFMQVTATMSALRCAWNPHVERGPQFGLWKTHATFLAGLGKIAQAREPALAKVLAGPASEEA